jgi:hypothetical protein
MGKRAFVWIQSFLEPVCKKGGKKGPARPALEKGSVGTQPRWGKREKRSRRAHSRCDGGGSAANRVRRLHLWLLNLLNDLKKKR